MAKPPCGRHPVAERLEVALQWFDILAIEDAEVVVEAVQPLTAGDEFQSPEQQVEAVRRRSGRREPGACRRAVSPSGSR